MPIGARWSSCWWRYMKPPGLHVTTPLPDLLELYRLRWDLTEVSLYIALFRAPHSDTADTRVAWDGLSHSLQALRAHCRHEISRS
jgi:hypothetical protein